MHCILCERSIEHFRPEFHGLAIDEGRTVHLCDECIRKIMRWQSERLAKLFPTQAMKKLHGRDRGAT